MQNYEAGPVGPGSARRDGRRALYEREMVEERGSERGGEGGQEGPAAPQPTSTSGLVKVSAAGPTLLAPLLASCSFLLLLQLLLLFFFLAFFFCLSPPPPLPPNRGPYRIIASYHVGTHALLRFASRFFLLAVSLRPPGIPRNPN